MLAASSSRFVCEAINTGCINAASIYAYVQGVNIFMAHLNRFYRLKLVQKLVYNNNKNLSSYKFNLNWMKQDEDRVNLSVSQRNCSSLGKPSINILCISSFELTLHSECINILYTYILMIYSDIRQIVQSIFNLGFIYLNMRKLIEICRDENMKFQLD